MFPDFFQQIWNLPTIVKSIINRYSILIIRFFYSINSDKLEITLQLLDDEKELNNIIDKIWEEKHGGKEIGRAHV